MRDESVCHSLWHGAWRLSAKIITKSCEWPTWVSRLVKMEWNERKKKNPLTAHTQTRNRTEFEPAKQSMNFNLKSNIIVAKPFFRGTYAQYSELPSVKSICVALSTSTFSLGAFCCFFRLTIGMYFYGWKEKNEKIILTVNLRRSSIRWELTTFTCRVHFGNDRMRVE